MSTSHATKVAPLERTTLTQAAFERLIASILHGTWKAGDRIPPERELCQQLGIARTSLREALKAMELIGMLDGRVGEGTFVRPRSEFLSRPLLWAFTGTDRKELKDIMEARTLIEEILAGLAAERGSDAEILAIGQIVQRIRDGIEKGQSILDPDMAFHLAVGSAAHNEVLNNSVHLLRNILRHWIYQRHMVPNVPNKVLMQHDAIYEAIRHRDPNSARKAMREHLRETFELITKRSSSPRQARKSDVTKR